jgi:putative transposase
VALSQSDLIDLLDAIRAGGDLDVVRRSVELVLQALIDTEATEVIGAATRISCSSRPPTVTAG